jgi:hypothetical protein
LGDKPGVEYRPSGNKSHTAMHHFLSLCFSSLYSIDVVKAQKEAAKMPHCPLELRASDKDNQKGVEYFRQNRKQIRADLLKYGAVWVRGFDLMKSVQGYREMHEALGFDPCLDPLHSSGLRKFAVERDALYEEVRVLHKTGLDVLPSALSFLAHPFHRLFTFGFLACRSTNLRCAATTLVCTASPPPSERRPMRPLSASKRPRRVAVASWWRTAPPFWPRWTPRSCKSCTTARFAFLFPIWTFLPLYPTLSRRGLPAWWMPPWRPSLTWTWK